MGDKIRKLCPATCAMYRREACPAVGVHQAACIDYKSACGSWASKGYCLSSSKYQRYMKSNCKKSCNNCPGPAAAKRAADAKKAAVAKAPAAEKAAAAKRAADAEKAAVAKATAAVAKAAAAAAAKRATDAKKAIKPAKAAAAADAKKAAVAKAKAASARADAAAKAKGIYMRCGTKFGNIRCTKKGDYCTQWGWCGNTAAHKNASSGKFDFKAIKPAKAAAEADTKKAAAAAAKAASDRADTAAKAKGIYMRCGTKFGNIRCAKKGY